MYFAAATIAQSGPGGVYMLGSAFSLSAKACGKGGVKGDGESMETCNIYI